MVHNFNPRARRRGTGTCVRSKASLVCMVSFRTTGLNSETVLRKKSNLPKLLHKQSHHCSVTGASLKLLISLNLDTVRLLTNRNSECPSCPVPISPNRRKKFKEKRALRGSGRQREQGKGRLHREGLGTHHSGDEKLVASDWLEITGKVPVGLTFPLYHFLSSESDEGIQKPDSSGLLVATLLI